MEVLLVLVALPLINRFCGMKLVPGKPLLWAVPAVGLLAWLANPTPAQELFPCALPLAWSLAFGFWRVWEWGRWIDLGGLPDDHNREGVEPTWFERLIVRLGGTTDTRALILRHSLCLYPGYGLLSLAGASWLLVPLFFCAGPALTLCYVLAKRIRPTNYVWFAEMLNGLIWAALMLLSA